MLNLLSETMALFGKLLWKLFSELPASASLIRS